MNELNPALIAGFSIFGATAAFVGVAFWYFSYATADIAAQFSHHEYEVKISRSIWLYYSSFVIALAYLMLYLLQYYGQGFAVKPDLSIIVWLRWLFYAVATYRTMYVLTKVMAHENDFPRKKKKKAGVKKEDHQDDPQAHNAIWAAFFSALFVFGAAVSQARETQIIWVTFSLGLFVLAVLSLFFPEDKIWGRHYIAVRDIVFSERSTWQVLMHSLPEQHRQSSIVVWSFIYRVALLVQWVISYLGLIIIWCLADGNNLTTVLDLRQTVIAFLVFDVIFVVPFSLLLILLTFKNVVKKVTITNKETGQVSFASQSHDTENLL
jgi:hypothetical protein